MQIQNINYYYPKMFSLKKYFVQKCPKIEIFCEKVKLLTQIFKQGENYGTMLNNMLNLHAMLYKMIVL